MTVCKVLLADPEVDWQNDVGHWLGTGCLVRKDRLEVSLFDVCRPFLVKSAALHLVGHRSYGTWAAVDVVHTLCKPDSRVEILLRPSGLALVARANLAVPYVTQTEMDDTRVALLDLHSHLNSRAGE